MTEEERDLMRRLAYPLDASLNWLAAQAAAEKRREEGKPLRAITWQQRAKHACAAVDEAFHLRGHRAPDAAPARLWPCLARPAPVSYPAHARACARSDP